jgi:FkbM family methyltransferase
LGIFTPDLSAGYTCPPSQRFPIRRPAGETDLIAMKSTTLPCGRTLHYRSPTALKVLSREFFAERVYERHDITLNDGDCIFDVGANIGLFLMQLNESLKNAAVFCFEPLPATFEVLRRNAGANDRLGAVLCRYGLGDASGDFQFKYQPRMDIGSSMHVDDTRESRRNGRDSVHEEIGNRGRVGKFLQQRAPRWMIWPLLELLRRWSTASKTVTCQVRKISDVIDEHQLESIDLLKIDVEGAEEAVLGGIREEHWPKIRQLVIETHYGLEQTARVARNLETRGFQASFSRCVENLDQLHLVVGRRKAAIGAR